MQGYVFKAGLWLEGFFHFIIHMNTDRVIFTSEEVGRLGIPCASPPPQPERCRFCGRELYFEGIVFGGVVYVWRSVPIRCTCSEASLFWQRRDEEKRRTRKEAEEARLRREREDRTLRLQRKSGLGRRFLTRSFERFQLTDCNSASFQAALDYAHNFDIYFDDGRGIYFQGGCGCGKTHLAAAISLYLIEQGREVIFMTFGDILDSFKRFFSSSPELSGDTSLYGNTELLVIDDLGKETVSDWSVSVLYSIINHRYEALLPTVITSNYDFCALKHRLTPKHGDSSAARAIISRLLESSSVITMNWKDYRA